MSKFNHLLCESCWNRQHPDRPAVTVSSSGPDSCCSCGNKTASGIYVRAAPDSLACRGIGPVHKD
jgi:hypothetical protein